MKRPEQILVNLLKENELTIAFAKSVSCGMLAHKMGTIAGTSEVFTGSLVCYNECIKTGLLKVTKKMIAEKTSESQEVTDVMAKHLCKIIPADVCAAITGLAAPGGTETKSKPVGTVFYALCFKGKTYRMKKRFRGSPLYIREQACKSFFKFITKEVKANLKQN